MLQIPSDQYKHDCLKIIVMIISLFQTGWFRLSFSDINSAFE